MRVMRDTVECDCGVKISRRGVLQRTPDKRVWCVGCGKIVDFDGERVTVYNAPNPERTEKDVRSILLQVKALKSKMAVQQKMMDQLEFQMRHQMAEVRVASGAPRKIVYEELFGKGKPDDDDHT